MSRIHALELLPENSIGAEIGVWEGHFSKEILQSIKPKELHLIDPWLYQTEFGERLYGGKVAKNQSDMNQIYSNIMQLFEKNTHVIVHRNFSHLIVQKFNDAYFDWVYIDGNHYYDYVKRDLELFFPKVKKNGYLILDDYHWTSPELMRDQPVKRAIDEFIQKKLLKIKILEEQFIIQKL